MRLTPHTMEQTALFTLGGVTYVELELAWRGASHWTMFAAGGACLCLLQALADRRIPLAAAAGVGAGAVTLFELGAGLICNRALHLAVWDYSHEWANLAGQICPKYSFLWFLLCGWVVFWLRTAARLAQTGLPGVKRVIYRTT